MMLAKNKQTDVHSFFIGELEAFPHFFAQNKQGSGDLCSYVVIPFIFKLILPSAS